MAHHTNKNFELEVNSISNSISNGNVLQKKSEFSSKLEEDSDVILNIKQ
jgi:hypothetical protein